MSAEQQTAAFSELLSIAREALQLFREFVTIARQNSETASAMQRQALMMTNSLHVVYEEIDAEESSQQQPGTGA